MSNINITDNRKFKYGNSIRSWINEHIVSKKWFDSIILIVILANCVTLAISNPKLNEDSDLVKILDVFEWIFVTIFTIEMLLKWIALGVFVNDGYFSDSWNTLDCIIVIASYLTLIPGVSNISAIRVLRVLRPLRTVNKLRGLRVIIQTLLKSLPGLFDVCLVLMFLFTIYSIIGLQLWHGKLRQQCFDINDQNKFVDESFCGYRSCDEYNNTICLQNAPNPGEGLINFDNIGTSLLTCFSAVTMADWVFTMYYIQDVWHPIAWLYFCSLILLVSFFALNLVLAVVGDQFKESSDEDELENPHMEGDEDAALLAVLEEKDRNEGINPALRQKRLETVGGTHQQDNGNNIELDLLKAPVVDRTTTPLEVETLSQAEFDNKIRASSNSDNKGDKKMLEKVHRESMLTVCRAYENSRTGLSPAAESMPRGMTIDEEKRAQQIVEKMVDDLYQNSKSNVPRPELDLQILKDEVRPVYNHVRLEVELKARYLYGRHQFVHKMFALVESPYFLNFIIFVIIVNTIFLSMEYHGMSDELKNVLDIGNYIFTITFILEMIFKLIAFGFKGYIRDPWNTFDGFIVITSVIELLIGGGGALSVLRTFRLLRVLKLARNIKSLRILMATVAASIAHVSYMTLLLGLFLFMFAVLGMQLYAGAYDNLADPPRSRYDSFWWSFVTVFQILTGDNWTSLMYSGVTATSTLTIVFYLSLVVIGTFIVINLFIAILLQNFEEQDESKFELEDLQPKAEMLAYRISSTTEESCRILAQELAKLRLQVYRTKLKRERKLRQKKEKTKMVGKAFGILDNQHPLRRFCWGLVHSWPFEYFIIVAIIVNCAFLASETPDMDEDSSWYKVLQIADIIFAIIFTIEMFLKFIAMGVFRGQGTYARNSWNRLDGFVVLVAWVSLAAPSVAVARALRGLRPLRVVVRSDQIKVVVTSLYRAMPAIANVFLFCFIFWLIFGILGVNLFAGKFYSCNDESIKFENNCVGTYVNDDNVTVNREWVNKRINYDNIFNAIITLFQVGTLSGWSDVMYDSIDVTDVGEGPKKNNHPEYALFYMWFIIVCSFFTLNLFIGVVIDNFNRLKQEFDGSAFLTEAQRQWVATQKIIKQVSLDTHADVPENKFRLWCYGVVAAPQLEASRSASLKSLRNLNSALNHTSADKAIIAYPTLSSVPPASPPNFSRPTTKDRQSPIPPNLSREPTNDANSSNDVVKRLPTDLTSMNSDPSRQNTSTFFPSNDPTITNTATSFQTTTYTKSNVTDDDDDDDDEPRNHFDEIIMLFIILNTVIMMMQHDRQSDEFTLFLYIMNLVFVVIFTVEAILKISAFTFLVYWSDAWNKFDFIIVVASIIGLFVNAGVGANVVRVLRIGRVFRLIKKAKTLKKMFDTLIVSIPSLWNIGLLLFVIFFIFGVLGITFFGKVKETDGGLSRNFNFRNFGNAMLALFRMATGDGWEEAMLGTTINENNSDCSEQLDNCGYKLAPLYHISFMIFGSLVMVNLFIAVILENFSEESDQDIDPKTIRRIKRWTKAWSRYDPLATKTLPARRFEDMMARAPLPFGFGHKMPPRVVLGRLQESTLPIFWQSTPVGERVRYKRPPGRRRGMWILKFDSTLRSLTQGLAGVSESTDESDEIEDAWDCRCRCFEREDLNKSTMAQWYSVRMIEQWYSSKLEERQALAPNGGLQLKLNSVRIGLQEDMKEDESAIEPSISESIPESDIQRQSLRLGKLASIVVKKPSLSSTSKVEEDLV